MRRQGVGSLLMNWIITQAQQLACHAIVLEVAVDNGAAQLFYRNFGFLETSRIPGYYNATTDAFVLELGLL